MTTFTHKGVEITLGANGKFSAQTPEGRITAASLDAIKKKLDKPAEFEPFKAFTLGRWAKKISDCTVTGTVKSRSKYSSDEWKTSDGDQYAVYADTPENRAAAQRYLDMLAAHAILRSGMDDAEQLAREALVVLRPGKRGAE